MAEAEEMIVVNGVRFRPEDKKTEFYKRVIEDGKRQEARRVASKARVPANKSTTPNNKSAGGGAGKTDETDETGKTDETGSKD